MNLTTPHEAQMMVDLVELKLLYRALHASITSFPELIDSQLFAQMQKMLQQAAFEDGVDVTDHGEWAAWLEDTAKSSSSMDEMSAPPGQLLN